VPNELRGELPNKPQSAGANELKVVLKILSPLMLPGYSDLRIWQN